MNVCLQGVAADVGIAACETFAGRCEWSYHLLSSNTQAGGFVVRWDYERAPFHIGPGGKDNIDLAHPAGWDHAVRGYVALRAGCVDESMSVSFEWTDCGWEVVGAHVPPQPQMRFPGVRFDTPSGRREALCRCICAALHLNVETVFPEEAP